MRSTSSSTRRTLRRSTRPLLALAMVLGLTACGGGEAGDGEGDAGAVGGKPAAAAGIPVTEPTGDIDASLASRGQELFKKKGCVACHRFGQGKLVGPDLEGITRRREFAWMYHMVTNPDSMVKADSTARALLDEYLVPMSDQNVRPEEFRAIYEYLRQQSQGSGGGAASAGG